MKTKTKLAITVLGLLLLPQSGESFYNPSIGRWMTRDPMDEEGGNNLYAFLDNSPLTWFDVLGLCGPCCCCAEDVKIVNVKKVEVEDKKGNKGIGHKFDTVVSLKYVSHSVEKDCNLKWLEKANRDVPELGLKAREWRDQTQNPNQQHTFDKSWGSRKKPCPGPEPVTDTDGPAIGYKSRARALWFRVIVESAPDCPCAHKSVEVTARQFLNPHSNPMVIQFLTPAPDL